MNSKECLQEYYNLGNYFMKYMKVKNEEALFFYMVTSDSFNDKKEKRFTLLTLGSDQNWEVVAKKDLVVDGDCFDAKSWMIFPLVVEQGDGSNFKLGKVENFPERQKKWTYELVKSKHGILGPVILFGHSVVE
jgi:hypothetical protein